MIGIVRAVRRRPVRRCCAQTRSPTSSVRWPSTTGPLEHAAARMRIAEVEPAGHLAGSRSWRGRTNCMPVVEQRSPEVAEQSSGRSRRAAIPRPGPCCVPVWHCRLRVMASRVVALDRCGWSAPGVAVLHTQVRESGVRTERQPDVTGEAVERLSASADPVAGMLACRARWCPWRRRSSASPGVAHRGGAPVRNSRLPPSRAFLEPEVQDTGDGVGAVLRRCAVAQHLGLLDRDGEGMT